MVGPGPARFRAANVREAVSGCRRPAPARLAQRRRGGPLPHGAPLARLGSEARRSASGFRGAARQRRPGWLSGVAGDHSSRAPPGPGSVPRREGQRAVSGCRQTALARLAQRRRGGPTPLRSWLGSEARRSASGFRVPPAGAGPAGAAASPGTTPLRGAPGPGSVRRREGQRAVSQPHPPARLSQGQPLPRPFPSGHDRFQKARISARHRCPVALPRHVIPGVGAQRAGTPPGAKPAG